MFELTTLTVIQHFLLGYVRELRQRFAINGIVLLYLILLGLTSQPLWISSTSIPCFSSILPPSLSHGFRFCSTVQAKQIFVFFPSHMHLKKKLSCRSTYFESYRPSFAGFFVFILSFPSSLAAASLNSALHPFYLRKKAVSAGKTAQLGGEI